MFFFTMRKFINDDQNDNYDDNDNIDHINHENREYLGLNDRKRIGTNFFKQTVSRTKQHYYYYQFLIAPDSCSATDYLDNR